MVLRSQRGGWWSDWWCWTGGEVWFGMPYDEKCEEVKVRRDDGVMDGALVGRRYARDENVMRVYAQIRRDCQTVALVADLAD